jgi:hemerythrin superfamily protein
MSTPTTHTDVVDLLLDQHEQVRQLFARVIAAQGREKLELFAALVDMLQTHERTEQEIVHPALAAADPSGGRDVVEDVLGEEREADEGVADLVESGVDDPAFDGRLADLRAAVVAHAAHEEEAEFPRLRELLTADQLAAMAAAVRKAAAEPW